MPAGKWGFTSITSAPDSATEFMRLFKVTACIPSPEKVRSQRELQNTFFTKWVPYDSWFAEQQRIQKQGGRIIKVELCTGGQQVNVGN